MPNAEQKEEDLEYSYIHYLPLPEDPYLKAVREKVLRGDISKERALKLANKAISELSELVDIDSSSTNPVNGMFFFLMNQSTLAGFRKLVEELGISPRQADDPKKETKPGSSELPSTTNTVSQVAPLKWTGKNPQKQISWVWEHLERRKFIDCDEASFFRLFINADGSRISPRFRSENNASPVTSQSEAGLLPVLPIKWKGKKPQAEVGWLFEYLSNAMLIDRYATGFSLLFVREDENPIKPDFESARKSTRPQARSLEAFGADLIAFLDDSGKSP